LAAVGAVSGEGRRKWERVAEKIGKEPIILTNVSLGNELQREMQIKSRYQYETVKKGEEGAVPAILIEDGSQTKQVWVRDCWFGTAKYGQHIGIEFFDFTSQFVVVVVIPHISAKGHNIIFGQSLHNGLNFVTPPHPLSKFKVLIDLGICNGIAPDYTG
jgi:hypothetical protein